MKEVERPKSNEITKEAFLDVKKRQRSVPAEQWILAREANPDYVIVSGERWQLAQEILARRYKRYTDAVRPMEDRTWKSPLLLVGLLECGYCHGKISPAVSSQKIRKADGSVSRSHTDFYKCNTRGRDKKLCPARSYISRFRLEKAVLEEVNHFLGRIGQIDCSDAVMHNKMIRMREAEAEQEQLISLKKEYKKAQENVGKFKQEIYKAIIGESDFDSRYINECLKNAEDKALEIKKEMEILEKSIQVKQHSMDESLKNTEMIPVWQKVFEEAPLNIKKKVLSILIENIVLTENEMDIYFKTDMDSFFK